VLAYVIPVSQTIITDKLITFTCILRENYSFLASVGIGLKNWGSAAEMCKILPRD